MSKKKCLLAKYEIILMILAAVMKGWRRFFLSWHHGTKIQTEDERIIDVPTLGHQIVCYRHVVSYVSTFLSVEEVAILPYRYAQKVIHLQNEMYMNMLDAQRSDKAQPPRITKPWGFTDKKTGRRVTPDDYRKKKRFI